MEKENQANTMPTNPLTGSLEMTNDSLQPALKMLLALRGHCQIKVRLGGTTRIREHRGRPLRTQRFKPLRLRNARVHDEIYRYVDDITPYFENA